jgi:beta-lactamase class A
LKLLNYFITCVLFLLLQTVLADAAQSQRYDLAYSWGKDIGQVLEYRQKVAVLLGLKIDSQLQVVGRGQEYGIVWPVKGTLEETKKTAQSQMQKLQRAGLKPAQTIKTNAYHNLYNVRYTLGPNLEIIKRDFSSINNSLGKQVSGKLFIEKIDSHNFLIVYRCWMSKAAALRFAQQHRSRLKKNKIPTTIISAVHRPAVQADTALLSETPNTPGRQVSRTSSPRIIQLQKTAKRTIGSPQARINDKNIASKTQRTGSTIQALPPSASTPLNNRMAAFLQEQKKKGRIRKERTAWVVYDLTNNTYVLSINSQRQFQAASMIKPFVALAFFHQVDKGKLTYTREHRRMMEAMIQHSSNPATNWFIRQVGGPSRCEAILKNHYKQLFKQVKIKEYIPSNGRTYKNSAQPSEYIQYLRALWNYQLPHSKEMLRVMSLPGRDRLCSGTDVPASTLVYNKTGSTAQLIGDMGILAPRGKNGRTVPYAIVGIVEGSARAADYKQWMQASGGVIRDFSSLVYEEMKQKHNLL